ncbi:MAG: glycoside hydrolase [Notoacmeibacter sp.]|nr:glycoside hydrolase [Notoacmeibacter sp.]
MALTLALTITDLPTAPWVAPGLGALILWLTGIADDRRGLGAVIKFAIQFAAAGVVVAGAGLSFPLPAFLPGITAQLAAAVVLVWFVNMVNFMDGTDLITFTGAGTATLFTGLLCLVATGDAGAWLAALAVFGALAGFAVHNRPPAAVFLGDSGSLPLGLISGILTLKAAAAVSPAIALLPFAYYLADTLTTLIKRALERKNILAAHSEHAYQMAKRSGLSAAAISARVVVCGAATGSAAVVAALTTGLVSWLLVAAGWVVGIALVLHLRDKLKG